MTDKSWAILCHLSALSIYLGVPFGNILGPLIIWLIKRDEMPYVDEQGKEALNFQISISLYALLASLLIFVVIGVALLTILAIMQVVLVVIAAVKVNNDEHYRYPLTIRFLK